MISINFSSSTSSWKPWNRVRLDLILTMRDIYIHSNLKTLTKFASSRSTEFRDILPWNISQMKMKTVTINTRILVSYAMLWGLSLWKSIETETSIKFPSGGKAIVEQILASEERKKLKRAGLWESQSGIQVGKLTIWQRSFEIHQVYQFHQNSLACLYNRSYSLQRQTD